MVKTCVLYTSHKMHLLLKCIEIDETSVNLLHNYSKSDCHQLIYYGISKTKFKTIYSNHKKSFNHEKHKNNTQLSNELWKIKASKEEPVLVWNILGQYQPYVVNTKRCLLCLITNVSTKYSLILLNIKSSAEL